jgi:hypothetical protein
LLCHVYLHFWCHILLCHVDCAFLVPYIGVPSVLFTVGAIHCCIICTPCIYFGALLLLSVRCSSTSRRPLQWTVFSLSLHCSAVCSSVH